MFLDIAVSRLKVDAADLITLARNIGKRHTCYKRVSFDAEYWLLFKNSVIDHLEPFATSNICTKTHGRNLWNKFLMYLIMEMKDAFYAEMKRRNSTEDLSRIGTKNSLFLQLERQHRECHSDDDVYTKPASAAANRPGGSLRKHKNGYVNNNTLTSVTVPASPATRATPVDISLLSQGAMLSVAGCRSDDSVPRDRSTSNFDLTPPLCLAACQDARTQYDRSISKSENDLCDFDVFDETTDVWL